MKIVFLTLPFVVSTSPVKHNHSQLLQKQRVGEGQCVRKNGTRNISPKFNNQVS